jgi:hypothetical protein
VLETLKSEPYYLILRASELIDVIIIYRGVMNLSHVRTGGQPGVVMSERAFVRCAVQ